MAIPPIAHDYIAAVHNALTALNLAPTEGPWIQRDTQLDYPIATAAIDLHLDDTTGLHPFWTHGLQIVWQWHDTDPNEDDSEQYATWRWGAWSGTQAGMYSSHGYLPVADVAPPTGVATAIHALATTGKPGPATTTEWEHAAQLLDSLNEWATTSR